MADEARAIRTGMSFKHLFHPLLVAMFGHTMVRGPINGEAIESPPRLRVETWQCDRCDWARARLTWDRR